MPISVKSEGCKVIQNVAHCSNLDIPELALNALPDVPQPDALRHSAQLGLCQNTRVYIAYAGVHVAVAKLLFFPMCQLVRSLVSCLYAI